MLDARLCDVKTADELDAEIRDIFALDMVGRGDEIAGTLNIYYDDESVRNATLIHTLAARGVNLVFHKKTL